MTIPTHFENNYYLYGYGRKSRIRKARANKAKKKAKQKEAEYAAKLKLRAAQNRLEHLETFKGYVGKLFNQKVKNDEPDVWNNIWIALEHNIAFSRCKDVLLDEFEAILERMRNTRHKELFDQISYRFTPLILAVTPQ